MKELLKHKLAVALSAVAPLSVGELERLLEKPKRPEHGELALPCFQIAKVWGEPPPSAAERIKKELVLPAGIEAGETVGPFLNFRFSRAEFTRAVVASAEQCVSNHPERVVLEYSSPNIAKPFHVGHLRATLIGNCLDHVYRSLGHQVVSINHLGDWGTQFGFVWAGCELWGKPESPTVTALVELYRKATSLKERQEKAATGESSLSAEEQSFPDVNALARQYFLDLEEGKEYATVFWKWCLEISLEYFQRTYKKLNVSFDHYTGESFYSDKLEGVRQKLEAHGVLKESQKALGVELGVDPESGEDLGFARVYTPDGRSLYLTRDLATAFYRAETFDYDRCVYVVGAPQSLHFRQLKGILKKLGATFAEKIVHVPFGLVLGVKTRGDGEFIELNEFLHEAYTRALTAYREQVTKRPEGLDEHAVAEAVGLSAIVFSTLSRNRVKDVHFSWDTALQFQGDSGPYVLYARARINGIEERATTAGVKIKSEISGAHLVDDEAFSLAKVLAEFSSVLHQTVSENEPSVLASYALELSRTFSKAYNELQVLGAEPAVAEERLALFHATGRVLEKTITLLGMTPVARM